MKIIPHAFGKEERLMGWHSYLERKLNFPFMVRCTMRRAISPLMVGDEIQVIGMAPPEECKQEIFVTIRWEKEGLAVPLSQLEVICPDEQTKEGVDDWLYYVRSGYNQ